MTFCARSIVQVSGFVFLAACGSDGEGSNPGGKGDGGGALIGPKLVINELQPSNKDTITDDHGDADDWIEIFNPEATPVDLNGYVVGDSGTKQTITGSLIIPAGGYVLLWADDSPGQGVAHLGFKLSAKTGDMLTLTSPTGAVVDTIRFGKSIDKSSYTRVPNGTGNFVWCASPTPGASNGGACGA